MNDQLTLLDLPETYMRALELLNKQLPLFEYIRVLTGSASLHLQQVVIPVNYLWRQHA
jgi:hypothetical protein